MNHNKKAGYLFIALSVIVGIAGYALINSVFTNHDTKISITENKKELIIAAEFPKARSGSVQDFLKEKLNMADLTDLSHLEIKHYSTPDKQMNFYIKCIPGSIELSMEKEKNDKDAYLRMKETGEEIKKVLTK